jgi:hypothetical protein
MQINGDGHKDEVVSSGCNLLIGVCYDIFGHIIFYTLFVY